MLENAWIIPLIPAASFFLILFFGKRLPKKGSEIGIAALAICFVLAIATNVEWFSHVDDAEHAAASSHSDDGGHAEEEGDSQEHGMANGESAGVLLPAAPDAEAAASAPSADEGQTDFSVEPVQKSWTWWSSRSEEHTVGMLLDGPGVMMLFLVHLISLLVHIYSTTYLHTDRRTPPSFPFLPSFTANT